MRKFITGLVLSLLTLVGTAKADDMMQTQDLYTATFGGGCFWCVESEFLDKPGVVDTRVGYMGGDKDDPSYRDVTTGRTGHAEVVEITFDAGQVSYEDLLKHFMLQAHDPTELNKQWVDEGTQYRSVIFYHNDEQKQIAEDYIAQLTTDKVFSKPIVTEIAPAETFWEAEDYHQEYYKKYEEKTGQPHIRMKLKKERTFNRN